MRHRTADFLSLNNESSRLIDQDSPSNNYTTEVESPTASPLQSVTGSDSNNEDDDNDIIGSTADEDLVDQITVITNRLRILFYTLYIPVIPLLTLLLILLLELVNKAVSSPPCSYPLRCFTLLSFMLFVYLPNHKRLRRCLFNYSRDNSDIVRPRAVRVYDQCIHMVILSYLYLDLVLVQSCKDDLDPGGSGKSTCMMTCPGLYESFERFDLILRIFAVVFLLPLICLPFVYLWIVRRINSVDDLTRLGMHLGSRDQDDLAGGAKVKEVMQGLRNVRLEKENVSLSNGTDKVRIVGIEHNEWGENKMKDWEPLKDCCVCMCEFAYDGKTEIDETCNNDTIIETKCGHLFHKKCIMSWIGGENWEVTDGESSARRRNCPLCREDLVADGMDAV